MAPGNGPPRGGSERYCNSPVAVVEVGAGAEEEEVDKRGVNGGRGAKNDAAPPGSAAKRWKSAATGSGKGKLRATFAGALTAAAGHKGE